MSSFFLFAGKEEGGRRRRRKEEEEEEPLSVCPWGGALSSMFSFCLDQIKISKPLNFVRPDAPPLRQRLSPFPDSIPSVPDLKTSPVVEVRDLHNPLKFRREEGRREEEEEERGGGRRDYAPIGTLRGGGPAPL